MSFSVLNSKAVRALVAGTLAPPGGMRCHHSPQLPCRDAEEGTPLGGELGLQTDGSAVRGEPLVLLLGVCFRVGQGDEDTFQFA